MLPHKGCQGKLSDYSLLFCFTFLLHTPSGFLPGLEGRALVLEQLFKFVRTKGWIHASSLSRPDDLSEVSPLEHQAQFVLVNIIRSDFRLVLKVSYFLLLYLFFHAVS